MKYFILYFLFDIVSFEIGENKYHFQYKWKSHFPPRTRRMRKQIQYFFVYVLIDIAIRKRINEKETISYYIILSLTKRKFARTTTIKKKNRKINKILLMSHYIYCIGIHIFLFAIYIQHTFQKQSRFYNFK